MNNFEYITDPNKIHNFEVMELENYMKSEYNLETMLSFQKIENNKHKVIGEVDLIMYCPKTKKIIGWEYKTNNSISSRKKGKKQLYLYMEVEKRLQKLPKLEVNSIGAYVITNGKGKYKILEERVVCLK